MGSMKDSKPTAMTNQKLQELIGSWFPNPEAKKVPDVIAEDKIEEGSEQKPAPIAVNPSLLDFSEEGSQFLNIFVQPEQLHSLMSELKNNKETYFDYLFCLSGVDWGAELGVVYHLESTTFRHTVVVKVKTPDRENPTLESVCDIWATA